MLLKNLKLTNYRNHRSFTLEPDKNITFILGPNGSGKTNILEAIQMLATTKSLRAEIDQEVIKYDKDFARVEGVIEKDSDEETLEIVIKKSEIFENASVKKVKINKVAKTLQNFAGELKAVLFSPQDIEIITGSPSNRRKYVDLILYQESKIYKQAHSVYTKALRQRNKLFEIISETGRGRDQMPFWDAKILEAGKKIQDQRKILFEFLDGKINEYERELNKTPNKFRINYLINEINEERMEKYRDKEFLARTTLIGPHRDDFVIIMDEMDIAHFGSRGQQRTAMLALKLSEIDYIKFRTNLIPVLLLDDIFSELDPKHKKAVLDTIQDKQTIITAAEEIDVVTKKDTKPLKITL